MAVPGMPPFSVRWTEPNGRLGKIEHTVDVNVRVPNENRGLSGHIDATSKDFIGRLPSGSAIGTARMVNDEGDLQLAAGLWKAVKGSNIRQWVPGDTAPGARLDRDDLELVIQRGKEKFEVYRTDLKTAAQPIQDIINAAGHVVGELRLGH